MSAPRLRLGTSWHELSTKRRCGAKSKRSQLPCRQFPVRGEKRCYHHGGIWSQAKTEEGQKRQRAAALKAIEQRNARRRRRLEGTFSAAVLSEET